MSESEPEGFGSIGDDILSLICMNAFEDLKRIFWVEYRGGTRQLFRKRGRLIDKRLGTEPNSKCYVCGALFRNDKGS